MAYPVADAHCDLLSKIMTDQADFSSPRPGQMVSRDGLKTGGVRLQVFALWYDPRLGSSPLVQCRSMAAEYRRLLADYPELRSVSAGHEPKAGEVETALVLEGGEALLEKGASLLEFWEAGVLALSLTWNVDNPLAGAAEGRTGYGLTALGKQMVLEAKRLSMAVDVSHLSDKGIRDILDMRDVPVFASHSNCRSVFNCRRSLPDETIRRISDRGGVVGVNFFHEHLGTPFPSTKEAAAQLRHLADVGGITCCAIGSDFDGIPYGLSDLQTSGEFQRLVPALKNAGFSEDEIEMVLYKNLRGFLRGLSVGSTG